ncbi:MAG: pilus assembly protein TadG-related protein [Acidimicrobiales bacterium]
MQWFERLAEDRRAGDRGAVAVLVGLFMLILCAAGAFAIDAGSWYRQSSQMQKAADIASLAGARVYGQGGSSAEVSAAVNESLRRNGLDPLAADIDVDISLVGDSDVAVTVVDNDVDLYFAGLFVDDIDLRRDATSSFGACLGPCETEIVIAPPVNLQLVDSQGDGFQPVVIGDRIFTVNHHIDSWDTRSVLVCVDLALQATCPGYPQLADITTSNHPDIVHDETTDRIWFGYQEIDGGQSHFGFQCWDTPTDSSCGRHRLQTYPVVKAVDVGGTIRDFEHFATSPFRVGDRIFAFDANHNVLCMVMSTATPCAGYPRPTGGAATIGTSSQWLRPEASTEQEAFVLGTRLYHTHNADVGPYLHCWDAATDAPCAEWSVPLRFDESIYWGAWPAHIFPSMNPSGVINGMCLYSGQGPWYGDFHCLSLDGSTRFRRADYYTALPLTPHDRVLQQEMILGTRMYVGNLYTNLVYCVDLAAGTSCGQLDSGGARPYTFTYLADADCIIGLGDAARLFSFTPDLGTCPTGEGEARILPCTCADGTVYWGEIEFDDALLAQFVSFVVTVRDPTGAVVAGPVDLIVSGNSVDLSGVAATVPYLDVEFDAEVPAGVIWTDEIRGTMVVTERPTLRN